MSLNKHIDDAALLASLALIILPIFTSTRENALIALSSAAGAKKSDASRQQAVLWGLVAVTAVVFAAGLPLWLEVIGDLSPTSSDGVARSLFGLTWILFLLLIGWQVSLICRAKKMHSELPGG